MLIDSNLIIYATQPPYTQLRSWLVDYALSRNLSPTLIAQYQLQLPDKKLLQAKLHEMAMVVEVGNE